jgi:Co/Zn/Cd efflux system component
MANESTSAPAQSELDRATLRIALSLNAAMFVVGMVAGLLAQSTGLIADAVDMLVYATTYALALLAVS